MPVKSLAMSLMLVAKIMMNVLNIKVIANL